MPDNIEIAISLLTERARVLRAERVTVGRRLLEAAVKDVELERDVAGCIAGVKALGGELTFPPNQEFSAPPVSNAFNQFVASRNAIAQHYNTLRGPYGISSEDDNIDSDINVSDARANMPRIADIIMDRLNIAGPSGSKSAGIRQFILDTYDADIHDKTVSMTLNRLLKEGLVRREGHIWFSASAEAKNPGDDDAGAQ